MATAWQGHGEGEGRGRPLFLQAESLGDVLRICSGDGWHRPGVELIWANSAEIGPNSAFGQHLATSTAFGPISAEHSLDSPIFGEFGGFLPSSAKVGPELNNIG